MRSKTFKFLIVIFFVAVLFIFAIATVFAETTEEQPGEITIQTLGAHSFRPNQFGYWYQNTTYGEHFTDTEMIHISSALVAAGANEQRGEFFLNMQVADNFVNASKNGYLQISAEAQVKSYDYNWVDATDCVDIILESGEYKGKSRAEFLPLSEDKFEINTSTYTPVAVGMTSELKGNGLRLRFYVHPTTYAGWTYGYIKQPKLILSTTDNNSPSVATSIDNDAYSNANKKLTINATDNESGIDYILVNGQKQIPTKVENNTKNVEVQFDVTQNGLYEIVAYDNVGNISSKTIYEESKIDKDIPSAPSIIIQEDWTDFSLLSINASYSDSGISPAKLFYAFGDEIPTLASPQVISDVIPIQSDTKKINFAVIDEAGNISDIVTKEAFDVVTTAINGSITAGGRFLHGYKYTATFEVQNGAKFVKAVVNGNEIVPTVGNRIQVVVQEDILIDIFIKAAVQIELQSCSAVYNAESQKPIVKNAFSDGTYILTMDEAIFVGQYPFKMVLEHDRYYGEIEGVFQIEKAPLKIIATAATKSYMSSDPLLEYVAEGLLGSDILTGNLEREIGEQPRKYEIFLGSIGNPNYEITYVSNYLTINKGALTIVAKNHSKTYGELDMNFEYTVAGLLGSDRLSGTLSRETGEAVGEYNILQGTLTAENYDIVFHKGKFTINKAVINVQASSHSKVYGQTDNDFEYTVTGLLGSDTLSGALSREVGEIVGVYEITLGSLNNPNYDIAYTKNYFTINKATMIVVASSHFKVYGQTDSDFEYVATGLLDGDILSGALSRELGESVGQYKISLGTLNNPNYEITYVAAYLTINKAIITVEAKSQSKQYGEADSNFEYTVIGILNGDILSGALLRELGENAGQYEILLGTLNNPNYDIAYIPNYLTINKATVTVAAKSYSKKYGEIDCNFEYVATGLLEGDLLDGKLTRVPGENAGIYTILQGTLSSINYDILFYSGKFTIEKNYLSLILEDCNGIYTGNPFNDFGLQLDSDIKVIYRIYRDGRLVNSAINVGEYTIEVFFAGNRNFYETTSNKAKLTIAKAQVEFNIEQEKFVYDGSPKQPKFSVSADVAAQVILQNECVEVGIYEYSIEVNSQNYFGSISGKFEIVDNVLFDDGESKVEHVEGEMIDKVEIEKVFDDSHKVDEYNSKYLIKLKSSQAFAGTLKIDMKLLDLKGKNVKLYALDKDGNMREVQIDFKNDTLSFSANDMDVSYIVLYSEEPQTKEMSFWWLVAIVLSGIAAMFGIGAFVLFLMKRAKDKKS